MGFDGRTVAALAALLLCASGCASPETFGTKILDTVRDEPAVDTRPPRLEPNKPQAGRKLVVIPRGPLASVRLKNVAGERLRLRERKDGSWVSRPLPWEPVVLVSRFADGTERERELTVRRPEADRFLKVSLWPQGGTWGVGQTITANLSAPVDPRDREAVAERMRVSGGPAGAWRFTDADTAVYRPKTFWPGHTKVRVFADLAGLEVRRAGGPVLWGAVEAERASWRTGRALVVKIRAAKHRGKVLVDGKTVRTFGVSTGKPGYITRSGVKTITEKFRVQRMTNVGVTDDEVYDLQVPYAMRLTSTGEFLHAAPWNGNIGAANTSHGCTNLTLADARWVYSRALWGDPVVTVGTGRRMELWNGPGAVWNVPWREWKSS